MVSWTPLLAGTLIPIAVGVALQLLQPYISAQVLQSAMRPLLAMSVLMIVFGMLQSMMMIPMAMVSAMRWY